MRRRHPAVDGVARRVSRGFRAFRGAADGVSAIEFALIFPVLALLLLAGFQLVLYINAMRRVEAVADSIAEMISQATPTGTATTAYVNAVDLHFAYDATLVLFPYVMTDAARKGVPWWQDITINFAGIKFQSNGLTCAAGADQSPCFIASVAWTSTGTVGANSRPCLVPQAPANSTAAPTRSTLPRQLYGQGSIVAVDVAFTFTPTFGAKYLPSFNIARSVFVQPRYASFVNYSTANSDGIAVLCPGFT